MFGCAGQPAPTEEASPTAVPVTDQSAETPAVAPTSDTPATEAPTESLSSQPGQAKLRLAPSADGGAVEIWVDDVAGLYALDIQLGFDADKFQADDADPEKDGIQLETGQVPVPDFVALNSVDNETGEVRYVVTQLGTSEAFSGSGLVATLHWKAGVSAQAGAEEQPALSFGTVTLVDKDVQQIEVATE